MNKPNQDYFGLLARLATALTASVVCLLASGCDGGPRIVPVTGKVTLDGKPMPFKSIYFFPERTASTGGNGAGGFTDGDSKYFLISNAGGSTSDKRGAQPGVYRVTVAEPIVPIDEKSFGSPGPEPSAGDAPAAAIVLQPQRGKATIPAVYTSPASTPLIVEVPEDGGEVNLELKSKP